MKILFLITRYDINDGASRALYCIIKNNPNITYYKVLCKIKWQVQDDLNIELISSGKDIFEEYLSGHYDLIHNFKAGGYDIFYWLQKELKHRKLNIPILTTVCQRPSFKKMLLSPAEIQYSTILVFIDKAAFNDHLINFIPQSRKEFNYFGTTNDLIELTDKISKSYKPSSEVIFGRGSTQSKCPHNMIDIYDAIELKQKKFVIAGCDKGYTWLHKYVNGRKDVILYGQLPFKEWLELCATFDIFLYQIPEDSHSSIDGVLSQAMLLRKPVVYYGSEAPKERFIHGYNGYIANNYEEIVYYAELLGNDKDLRKKIGENARKSTIEQFSIMKTVSNYNTLYNKINTIDISNYKPTHIPLYYIYYYYSNNWKEVIKLPLKGSFIEKIYRRLKPLRPNY